MKAFYLQGKEATIVNLPKPEPQKTEALVKVSLAGICKTDLELIKGYMNFDGVLGHEFVGVVESCSNSSWLGKRVCGEINFGCRKCDFCAHGLSRHCPNRTVLGILNQNGAFAEHVILPIENLRPVPDSVSDEQAVFVEPLAAAFEILEQIKIQPNENVAVIGDGRLGLLICQVLKLTGCKLTLIGKHENKLTLARSWGIQTAKVSKVQDTQFTTAIEASGSPSGFETAMRILQPRGTLVLKSTYAEDLQVNAAPIVINEISIVGSRCGLFEPAIRALSEKLVHVHELIEEHFIFEEVEKAFEFAAKPGVMKVLVDFSG